MVKVLTQKPTSPNGDVQPGRYAWLLSTSALLHRLDPYLLAFAADIAL